MIRVGVPHTPKVTTTNVVGPGLTDPGRSRPGRVVAALAARWPTWLALAIAALTLADVGDGSEFTVILLVAAVGYLPVAVLERRSVTWPVVILFLLAIGAVGAVGLDVVAALLVFSLLLVAVGLVAGPLRRPGPARLQAPAALLFAGAGLLALVCPPDLVPYIVASGLLGHAAWDGYHWFADRIVARSFAEWCGVLDATLGVGILLLV